MSVNVIFTVAWVSWLAWFGVWEIAGLMYQVLGHQEGMTFSDHWWGWFGVRDPRPTWLTWTSRAGMVVFGCWLIGHLAFGWWTL